MRLAFFVNDVATEVDEYTTTRLARAAALASRVVVYSSISVATSLTKKASLMPAHLLRTGR